MAPTFTERINVTRGFDQGSYEAIVSFTANIASIKLTAKPEYAATRQVIGTLIQFLGGISAQYDLYSGDDVISLELPETSKLIFFPTGYLNDSYTLKIDTATVGNFINSSNSASIPELILLTPNKVIALESITQSLVQDEANLSSRVNLLENAPVTTGGGGSLSYTLVGANQALESNKKYLATVSGLVCSLPSSPEIGDVICLSTGNFSFRVNHGKANEQILNLSTLTSVGIDSGIILKADSDVDLTYLGSNLWKTGHRSRVINNYAPSSLSGTQLLPVSLSTTSNSSAYGTTLAMMQNGIKAPTGSYATDGYLDSTNQFILLCTNSVPFALKTIKLWSGQGNTGLGAASDFSVNGLTVYRGATVSDPLIGTFSPINSCGTEQPFSLENSSLSTQYLLKFDAPQFKNVGILELELYGQVLVEGETIAA